MRTDWLGVAVLVACAPQPPPQPPVPPASPVPSVDSAAKAAVAPRPSASTDIESSTPDPVRCPNPYDPAGWVPKKQLGAEQVRLMNERFGLICSKRDGRAGCTDKRGRIVIPFIYVELSPFAESGLALALQPDVGWVYIDHRHRRIGEALSVDNQPDEVFGGYARFKTASGKIGFLDRERRVAIPARYDGAFPFSNCKAMVCTGCHPLRWSTDAPQEAACTGNAFLIDESGEKLQASAGTDWEECDKKQGLR